MLLLTVALACTALSAIAHASEPGPSHSQRGATPNGNPAIQKVGPNSYRIGQLRIDTARRELMADGRINDVTVLEFVANTRNGAKAYESALTIDTDAVSFNAALLLIGLDPGRSRVPGSHFDSVPPKGDPVDIFVEWVAGAGTKRVNVEELLYDKRTNAPIPAGPWAYTGSTFVDMVDHKEFLAEMDGVLIGFVHSPAPLIENPRAGAVDSYGAVILNPNLGLTPGLPVTLTVRALPRR